jgi:hypothetical protein
MEIRKFVGNIEGDESKEMEERLVLSRAVFNSVKAAYLNHKALGEDGKDLISKQGEDGVNDHLRGDLESEEKMVDGVDKWGRENGIKVKVRGEEVGGKVVGSMKSTNEALVVMDGLDGTANYGKKGEWSYGSMLAVALNGDPSYNEFDVGAVGLFEEGLCLMGIKSVGVFVVGLKSEKVTKLDKFNDLEEFDYGLMLADDYFEPAKRYIGEHAEKWGRTGSTAATLAAIAIGDAIENREFPVMNKGWQGLVDVGRKGMLEWPVVYLVIRELGGFVVDKNGEDIGARKFVEFSQKKDWLDRKEPDVHEPIVVAKNKKVLNSVRGLVGK